MKCFLAEEDHKKSIITFTCHHALFNETIKTGVDENEPLKVIYITSFFPTLKYPELNFKHFLFFNVISGTF